MRAASRQSCMRTHVLCLPLVLPFLQTFSKFLYGRASLSQKKNWSLHYSYKSSKILLQSFITHSIYQAWFHILSDYFQKFSQINSPKQKFATTFWKTSTLTWLVGCFTNTLMQGHVFLFSTIKKQGILPFTFKTVINTLVFHGGTKT